MRPGASAPELNGLAPGPASGPAHDAEVLSAPDALETLALLETGVLCLDAALTVRYANAACAAPLGVRLDALVGRPLVDVVAASEGDAATLHAVARDGLPRCLRLGGAPGSVAPGGGVPGNGTPPLDLLARRTRRGYLVVTVRPVPNGTAEQERLRALTRTMAAEADAATLIDTVCRAAVELCEAHGGTVAELDGDVGRFVGIVGHPDTLRGREFPLAGTLSERALDEYRRTSRLTAARAEAGEADDSAFFPYLDDGRVVGPLLLAPLGAHGELLGVLAVSRARGEAPFSDVDERRLRVIADHASLALWKARLIEEAVAANATKSNFLATVSHELRTPLTALTGYGELLADEIVGPLTDGQREIVDRVRAVTHQLTAMIEEILTFSSLEAGRELVRPRPLDPAEALLGVASVVEPLAAQKGLAYDAEVAPGLPPIVSDPDKVRQILVNLAGNGVKFTDRGGVAVRVSFDAGRGELRCAVTDSGVGIAPEDVGRLFQPFTQIDTGLTRRYGGTGLGLYISRRLAELLGGRIELASAPGRGSTFTLVLPVAP